MCCRARSRRPLRAWVLVWAQAAACASSLPPPPPPYRRLALSCAADQWLLPRATALCDRLLARALAHPSEAPPHGCGGSEIEKAIDLLQLATAMHAPLRPRLVHHVTRHFDEASGCPGFARLTRETIVEIIAAKRSL